MMKLGKKILSLVTAMALVIAMLPAMSFDALAEEPSPEEMVDYSLVLKVEEGSGKAYKDYVYADNAIELPEGISYADGVWTMDGFEFTTSSYNGVVFNSSEDVKLNLAPGSENSINVAYAGSSSMHGLYSSTDLVVNGSGKLDITAAGSEATPQSWYCYGIYSGGSLTVNGGTVNVTAGNAYYGYGVFIYEDCIINGGKLNACISNVPENSLGIYVYGSLKVNGGELNAIGGENCSYGVYARKICLPFNGTTNFYGSERNIYFNQIVGDDIERSAKSDYMSYSGLYAEEIMEEYGLLPAINVMGYYSNNWIKTTYGNQGYNLSTSNLGTAKVVSDAEFVYGGHYVLLSYTVEAEEAISDGHIGIWTDVQIGDNDYAPINVVKDEDSGETVGFELVDNHTESQSCANLNAKYMCYFDGYMISSAIGSEEFEPASSFWFGGYWNASDNVFNNFSDTTPESDEYYTTDEESGEITGLTNTDSGIAVSWTVNLEAGESKTYYALLGIGDATFKERPKYIEETTPVITEDGKVTVTVDNKVENKEDAGSLTLSVITKDGSELTVGEAPLLDLSEQTEAPFLLTATYTDRQINARPGIYSIKTVRATNKGGMFTDYNFADEAMPTVTVTVVPRNEELDLRDTQPGFESLLYEGWEWDKDSSQLSLFGLDMESEEGISLPAGASVIVEGEGAEINVAGSGMAAIKSEGSLTVKNKNIGEGTLVIDAPVGISADGDVTIRSSMELNVSETAIQMGEGGRLNIEDGAELVINLTDDSAVMFRTGEAESLRVNIPDGYVIEGGSIDENGFLVPDEGVTTLKFIDLSEVIVTFDYNGHGPVEVATASVAKRSTVERPEDPQAFGWSFQGWETAAGEIWNFLTGTVQNKMTLTAKWVKDSTTEKTAGGKTFSSGIATVKTSTALTPEVQKEKEIVDELMANKAASTVPATLRAAISEDTYEQIADEIEEGGKVIVGLNVDLIGCEAEEETATSTIVTIRYDVHPWYQIKNSEEDEGERVPISNEELNGKSIVFRLPLTAIAADYKYVKLRHYLESGDEDLTYLPVCTYTEDDRTEYFVNVTATQFSVFEMTFTNEKDEEERITSCNDENTNWWSFTDKGWVLHNGSWYNIQDNRLVKGWYFEDEDGNWYYMDPESGAMKTGWVNIRGNWFYLNPVNSRQTWFKDENGSYHFGGDAEEKPLGALYTGCTTPDGYEVDETGAMVKHEEL